MRSEEPRLPPGYRLDRSDPDVWTLRPSARCRYSCVHNRKWKLEKNPRFARKGG